MTDAEFKSAYLRFRELVSGFGSQRPDSTLIRELIVLQRELLEEIYGRKPGLKEEHQKWAEAAAQRGGQVGIDLLSVVAALGGLPTA